MEIKIKDQTYKMKYTLRAMIIFEKITNKQFSLSNLTDQIIYFYSLLLANNKDMTLTLDELIEEMDKDQTILQKHLDFLQNEKKKEEIFDHTEGAEDKKKE